jgi:PBP1b-binding outer membrane lipoprotein LpoB
MKTLKRILAVAVICLAFVGCSTKEESTKRKFIVRTTEDNNWTSSGYYECDSVHFYSQQKADVFVDGIKITVYSKCIMCFQNY